MPRRRSQTRSSKPREPGLERYSKKFKEVERAAQQLELDLRSLKTKIAKLCYSPFKG